MPVYKDKKGHWYFVITINYKQYKRVKINNQYMLSKAEAKFQEQEFIKMLNGVQPDDITCEMLFDEYVNASKTNLKPSTQLTYTKFKRNYLILLDNKKIHDLKPTDLLSWKNKLNDLDVSIQYKNRIQNIMKDFLNYGCIMYNLSGRLQYSLMQPFKDNKVQTLNTKSKYLEIENFNALVKSLDKTDYYYIILNTLYYTGLRIGELAALTKNDITKDFIIVNKDYSRVNGVDIIQAPKNKNSIRRVPIDSETYSLIELLLKDKKGNDIVFNNKSKYLNQQKLRRVIKALQQESNLTDYDITPHTLRHSYSSNLKKLGLDEFTISKLLGNTPEIATTTYIHVNLDFKDIAEKIKDISKN